MTYDWERFLEKPFQQINEFCNELTLCNFYENICSSRDVKCHNMDIMLTSVKLIIYIVECIEIGYINNIKQVQEYSILKKLHKDFMSFIIEDKIYFMNKLEQKIRDNKEYIIFLDTPVGIKRKQEILENNCSDELELLEELEEVEYLKYCSENTRYYFSDEFAIMRYYDLISGNAESKDISENEKKINIDAHNEFIQITNHYNNFLSLICDLDKERQKVTEEINPVTITKYLYSTKTGKEFLPPSLIKFLDGIESRQKEELAPPQVKNSQRPKYEVSQKSFAKMCGVSERTIREWEKGNGTPPNYPGRARLTLCNQFAENHKSMKAINREGRNIKKASTGHNTDNYNQSYYYDE